MAISENSNDSNVSAVLGENTASGISLSGKSDKGAGFYGENKAGNVAPDRGVGVWGESQYGFGLFGSSDHHLGVRGISKFSIGVNGINEAPATSQPDRGCGVHGEAVNGYGVYGVSDNYEGIHGETHSTQVAAGNGGRFKSKHLRKIIVSTFVAICTVLFCPMSEALVGGHWVKPQGNGIVIASGGKNILTVCRVEVNGNKQPGNLWQGHCYYGLNGSEYNSTNYEVLLDNSYSWVNPGRLVTGPYGSNYVIELPSNAIDGGEAGNGSRFAICEAYTPEDSTWRPGKFYDGKCYIAWIGKERMVETDITNQKVRVLVK